MRILVFLRDIYGGEGGSRTHEPGFARLPAFEAGSFDHSDTSPRWLSHSSGRAATGQRRTSERFNTENAEFRHRGHRETSGGLYLLRFQMRNGKNAGTPCRYSIYAGPNLAASSRSSRRMAIRARTHQAAKIAHKRGVPAINAAPTTAQNIPV